MDEFKVYEDGQLQPIHTFALESYKATQDRRRPEDQPEPQPAEDLARPSPA